MKLSEKAKSNLRYLLIVGKNDGALSIIINIVIFIAVPKLYCIYLLCCLGLMIYKTIKNLFK